MSTPSINKAPLKVAHLTSAHPRFDTRIYRKQCTSVAAAGYDTYLIVADGLGDEVQNDVKIQDVGILTGRLNRILKTTRRVFQKAIEVDADIYHFHDPELLPIGLKLKKRGKLVVFDSHEDFASQMLGKAYLGRVLPQIVSKAYKLYENYACRQLDAIVTATPFIRDLLVRLNPNTIDVNNYPMIGELELPSSWSDKKSEICYVGWLGAIRGVREMVEAMPLTRDDVRLNLGGRFFEPDVEEGVRAAEGWTKVNELGYLDRSTMRDILGRSLAGMLLYHPLPNHFDAQPNKMFEYMSASIPVIASNFPLWKDILETNQCGICVDPHDIESIAGTINELIENPGKAQEMGENGLRAVKEKYNWDAEAPKLLQLYQELVAG